MFTLGRGVYNELTKKEEFFVVILGLDNAGKTVSFFCYFTFIILIFRPMLNNLNPFLTNLIKNTSLLKLPAQWV